MKLPSFPLIPLSLHTPCPFPSPLSHDIRTLSFSFLPRKPCKLQHYTSPLYLLLLCHVISDGKVVVLCCCRYGFVVFDSVASVEKALSATEDHLILNGRYMYIILLMSV